MIKISRPPCPYPKALADKNYKHDKNKAALAESSHGKCMYCEAKITHVNYGHVEHIKPKAVELYPELEFEWSNLGYVCDRCNVAKGKKFIKERPFIDPYAEDPSVHLLAYGPFIFGRNGSERGELTVNELTLNRAELVEQRGSRIKAIQAALSAAQRTTNPSVKHSAISELKKEALPDKEYSAVVSAFLATLGVE